MRITLVGTGYVGLVTGACLAEYGNEVVCLDLDPGKIDLLKRGVIPIFEPGLEEMVRRNAAAGRLHFTTDIREAVEHGLIQFIAVGTPPGEDGSADLKHVLAAARAIAVLTGQTPQSFRLPESSVNVLAQQPAAPEGQTPQGMLERRPDIRAHAAQVNAYAAKLASAKADLLPRFTINFLGQGGRIEVDGDSALKGWGSLLSVGIQMPIFTNGRIQANIAAADARLQTALLQYDQTVLRALGEVDNAYQAQASLARQNRLLADAQQQAARQAADAQKLFRHGNKTLDEALRAQLGEQEMADSLTRSQLARAQMTVNLYKALGGGWNEMQTP